MSPLTATKHFLKASEHPIESVTVFRSSNAQIVRILNLDLKAGSNDIEISGLSSSIDTESLRVSGLGDARLSNVVCIVDRTIRPGVNTPLAVDEAQPIREAKTKIRALKAEKEAREGSIEMLFKYGQGLGGTSITPEEAFLFTEKALAKKLEVVAAVQKLDDEVTELERFVEQNQQPIKGDAKGKATITVVAHDDGKVQLTVSYLVGNVQWSPTYDLHAKSDSGTPLPSVVLHYRVHLSQRTGEHWNDTTLVLSTTDTNSLSSGIPEPKSLKINLTRNLRGGQTSLATYSATSPRYSPNSPSFSPTTQTAWRSGAPAPAEPVYEGVAFVSKSPLCVTYAVEGKSTIPSDGDSHKVSVAQLPFEATISHVIVARQETLAYLQCEVKNTTDYHLLPGPVSVFMDDGYVSKTSIPDINTGDMFRCTLGVDASTRVTYNIVSTSDTSRASAFIEQYKVTTYTSTTTISNRNTANRPISVIEKSSIPVAPQEDTRIRVFLKQPERLAESEDAVETDLRRADKFKVKWSSGSDKDQGKGGKQEGKFVWLGSVPSGKEVTLVSQWEVKAPIDVDWLESSYSS